MIYAIAMFGCLKMRTINNSMVANGRTKNSRGQYVWQTLEEAILAAASLDALNLKNRPHDQRKLGENTSWVVIGVAGDWDKDTDVADSRCQFPTANELLYDRPMVEIEQTLPLILAEKIPAQKAD